MNASQITEVQRRMKKIRKHMAAIEALIADGEAKGAEEDPWYPEDDPEFGPWVEYDGSVRPAWNYAIVQTLLKEERKRKCFGRISLSAGSIDWENNGDELDIVAYRVKK